MDESRHGATIISSILRQDRKVTSYKIALVRAINDVALAFPDLATTRQAVAIPLWMLAEWWIAYYWPFVGTDPIRQGPQAHSGEGRTNDMAFRPALTHLRQTWEETTATASLPAEGFIVRSELRVPRRFASTPSSVRTAYTQARTAITKTLEMPIRYAGPSSQQWSIFPKPCRFSAMPEHTVPVPGTDPTDVCVRIDGVLWHSFCQMTLWIEALCLHEWCLLSEAVQPRDGIDRGTIYRLLTARPDNRRPLTWERHQIDLLLLEGMTFTCPWTQKALTQHNLYDLDHLIPIAVYPTNELWNLIPSDPTFNQHTKRDRIPSAATLARAEPQIVLAYRQYDTTQHLHHALHEDVALRFSFPTPAAGRFPEMVTTAVLSFVEQLALARNSPRF